MKNLKNINYDNCTTNLACSILKYFGVKYENSSLKYIDDLLEKSKPKNVVVILCDGMGTNIMNRVLPKDSFLRKNNKRKLYSVFPPTTTAATTSIITGLNPNQHCWLGWENYIKELDQIVVMFLNKIKDTDIIIDPVKNVSYDYFGYTTLFDKINKLDGCFSTCLSPFRGENYTTFNDMCNRIKKICNNKEKNYIYAYYVNPDELMHEYGTTNVRIKENITMINRKLEKLCNSLKDTLVIITADHGHIDSTYFVLEDYPDIFECLERNTSVDSRASMFFIKKGYLKKFETLFNKYFGKYFILKTKKEILESNLFGIGKNHKLFESCLGDYIAISISDKNIKYQHVGHMMVSSHSGNTEDENIIPLIVVNK